MPHRMYNDRILKRLCEVFNMKSNAKGSLLLILCAFIWGMAFSAQSQAAEYIDTFTFVFLRSVITSAVLFAIAPLLNRRAAATVKAPVPTKRYALLGLALGAVMVAATSLQQLGLKYTSTVNSGFITALYIVIIPILGLFTGRRCSPIVWLGVALSIVGLYLLCIKGELKINVGDAYTLACALFFSFQIIMVDRCAGDMNSVLICAAQFGFCALFSLPLMLILETPTWEALSHCWGSVLYVAVCSGAIGYTLQIAGQKYTQPTLASLLMCLEAVFSAIGGWILLGQTLNGREILGCVLMLSASMIAQIPASVFQKKKQSA